MGTKYFKTDELIIDLEDDAAVNNAYNKGFVLTRISKGKMIQTRSLRIDLKKFEPTSENRRILSKTENLDITFQELPLQNYSWEVHKMGKEFYSTKFGDGTMSASKIKEMFTDMERSNMNAALKFQKTDNKLQKMQEESIKNEEDIQNSQPITQNPIGYCLCYENSDIIHYAYPFYDLKIAETMSNIGLGMMLKAILWAKDNNKSYIYLGSIVDETSRYKLQFEGLEWWDEVGKQWSSDIEEVKRRIKD